MFVSEALKTYFEESATVRIQSLILAEWNMNMPDNIFLSGNYRYRPNTQSSIYSFLPNTFDNLDLGNYYTGATDADIVIDNGFTDSGTPQQFTLQKDKMKMLYSLEDCLKPFRPRSGINKVLFFRNKYLSNSGENLAERPRYYMSSKNDEFKYWTSYRTEDNVEYGVSSQASNGLNFITDAAPFVVYKEQVPANRVVVKMQTNVGTVDLGPFTTSTGTIDDPLFGEVNKTTPLRWKIQHLINNNWVDAITFNENSTRDDGSPIIAPDGYVETEYGLIVPDAYKDIFVFAETIASATILPESSVLGYSYLVTENNEDIGLFYIWTGSGYETFVPNYGWSLGSQTIKNLNNFVTDVTNPNQFLNPLTGSTSYRQFEYISGIRVAVETMNRFDCTFDLIEMSPRLVVDVSDKTIDYKVSKVLSDVGITSLPVGQLLASTGSINLFDDDQGFNPNNSQSIIANYLRKNIKFSFYEIIVNVDNFDYYVPIKTLYSEGVPQADVTGGTISINLRDFYFFLESMNAPRLLLTQTSLSVAISVLMDSIGYTNYTFKRLDGESDPVIPYFFVAPEQNVAEVLNQLAISTQSAMFFDEYNNFVVMSKDYLMPSKEQRPNDLQIVGQPMIETTDSESFVYAGDVYDIDQLPNSEVYGAFLNRTDNKVYAWINSDWAEVGIFSKIIQPNILSISSQDKKVYNGGKISYTTRYIQRSYGTFEEAEMVDREKVWIYKPSLLWEVSGDDTTKTINEVASKQSKYVLGAMPLNSDLSNSLPTVVNGVVVNNVIDLGENIYWLTRYQGFFYSNGEIIKYDAAQFNVTGTGNVWITSNQEYQKYFASLPFNGKIYPTGLIRIYSEPFYETVDGISRLQAGAVYQHGRGQFGTPVESHTAGINPYWSNNSYVRGCNMQTQYLFTTVLDEDVTRPATSVGPAGLQVDSTTTSINLAQRSTRNSIIKNFMATNYSTETEVNSLKTTQVGTIQSSALIINGPNFKTADDSIKFISYVYKNLDGAYKNFGTRMRIIGKIESNENRAQTPIGSSSYYTVTGVDTDQNGNIGGGSGGVAVLLNPATNNGYYFEIVALTERDVDSYLKLDEGGNAEININNVVFYKIKKDSANDNAIPIKLWGGIAQITVDDGRFAGQYRFASEESPTVYDLSVEYEDYGSTRRFYLYINNQLIKVVDDTDPLPIYNNMALFVRGSARCMFENVYALSTNYAQNPISAVGETMSDVFGDKQINTDESFRKYAMSGIIQSTYLSGISSGQPPQYNMYFEEFGSIMRECSYFNIKYDRAYPALYAQIAPTTNRIKGYSISGFQADAYGAEFLIFNATDKALSLDETSGNFLRISGIAFTQDTTYELSVDEYFNKTGNLSDPELQGSSLVYSPLVEKSKYNDIKLSRVIYGKNDFALDTPYIQTQDDANNLMGWLINKIMSPKKSIGVSMYAIPTLQLGDIVTIDYKDNNGLDLVSSSGERFVIYNIEYGRSNSGPTMTLYLSEV